MKTVDAPRPQDAGATSALPSPFRSPRAGAEYLAAYDATLGLWPVPHEPLDVRSRFGSTHVVACGPAGAPPLVLLHCFFTSLAVWANNVADLSREHRVYALDMMGQPSRSVPDQPIRTRAEMAEWLTSVVDGLGLGRFDLVGYSYGGFAALNYAVHAPGRVRRLVLLSPAGLLPLRLGFYLRALLTRVPGLTRPAMRGFFRWMFHQPNVRRPRTRPLAERVLEQMVLGTTGFRVGTMVQPAALPDDELRAVGAPTLLLVGREEKLYDAGAAVARAERLIPRLRAEVVPGAAHDLPVGRPEVVDAKVLAFLGDAAA